MDHSVTDRVSVLQAGAENVYKGPALQTEPSGESEVHRKIGANRRPVPSTHLPVHPDRHKSNSGRFCLDHYQHPEYEEALLSLLPEAETKNQLASLPRLVLLQTIANFGVSVARSGPQILRIRSLLHSGSFALQYHNQQLVRDCVFFPTLVENEQGYPINIPQ